MYRNIADIAWPSLPALHLPDLVLPDLPGVAQLRALGIVAEPGQLIAARFSGMTPEGLARLLVQGGTLDLPFPAEAVARLQTGAPLQLRVEQVLPRLILSLLLLPVRIDAAEAAPAGLPPDAVFALLKAFGDETALQILMRQIVPLPAGLPLPSITARLLERGFFYEAQLARHLEGQVPLAALQTQPQLRLQRLPLALGTLPRLPDPANAALPEAWRDAVNRLYPAGSAMACLLEQQLGVLANRALQIPIYAWGGQPALLRIEAPPEPPPPRRKRAPYWEWVILLESVVLGRLCVRLSLAGQGVTVGIGVERDAVRDGLGGLLLPVLAAFRRHGITLQGWQLRRMADMPAPADKAAAHSLPAPSDATLAIWQAAREAGVFVHDNPALLTLLLELEPARLLPPPMLLAAEALLGILQQHGQSLSPASR